MHTATLGTGGPVVSLAEDLAAVVGSLLAVFAPVMGLAFFTLLAWFAWKGVMKLRQTFQRPAGVDSLG